MSKAVLLLTAAIVAVVAFCAAVVVTANEDLEKNPSNADGAQMEFIRNNQQYLFTMYLGQKGSSERTLVDDGGTFNLPSSDPIIILVAKNPASPISIEGNKIVIPHTDYNAKANIGFQYADVDPPVLIDSNSAYYTFTPTADLIHLGIFVSY
ncbi:MAG: hypothetical protein E7Z65_02115 [Thermoplasmata archaeon]|jgi:hypothetical protein|nr:hypothetical protein [Thermoplasmata archaeon]